MEQENSRSEAGAPVAQSLGLAELEGGRAEGGPITSASALASPLRNVRVRLTVCLGSAELTVGELLSARAQQVLKLDAALDQPVDVLLDGQLVARGTLVAIDDRFGVRISELPSAMDASAAGATKA
jgi:flagellar motor switch protein FliN/FliY